MKLFSFAKKKEKDFLVLDFGSSSIKGLIFNEREDKILIKKSETCEIEEFGVFSAKNFQSEVVKKTLTKILSLLIGNQKPSSFKTIISFPSDILKTEVLEVSLKRKNPDQKISRLEEEKIIQEAIHSAGKKLFGVIQKRINSDPAGFQIVKTRILEKKISGYKVSSIFGFRGERLDFKVLLIFGLAENLNFIQDLIKEFKFFDFIISHETEGLMAIRKLFPQGQIFLDVGASSTQFFIFNDILEFAGEIEIGGIDFSKKLCSLLGITSQQAETLKTSFSSGEMSREGKSKICLSLEPILSQWKTNLNQVLSERKKILKPGSPYFVFGGAGNFILSCCEALRDKGESGLEGYVFSALEICKLPLIFEKGARPDQRYLPAFLLALSNFKITKNI